MNEKEAKEFFEDSGRRMGEIQFLLDEMEQCCENENLSKQIRPFRNFLKEKLEKKSILEWERRVGMKGMGSFPSDREKEFLLGKRLFIFGKYFRILDELSEVSPKCTEVKEKVLKVMRKEIAILREIVGEEV